MGSGNRGGVTNIAWGKPRFVMMRPTPLRIFVFFSLTSLAGADLSDLWITEVQPSTGQVEVTNVSEATVTASAPLPFCHRLIYSTSIPQGTSFGPGESRVFSIAGLNAADSDLWLYLTSNFPDATQITSGLKWGPAPGVGRAESASIAGKWSGVSDGTAVPGTAAESIQLIGPDPFNVAHWAVRPIDLGHFPEFQIGFTAFTLTGNQISLQWEGSVPPYQVQSSPGLPPVWKFETEPLDVPSASFAIEGDPERLFFRVISGEDAVVPLTAEYQLTFVATWSAATHPTDFPGSPHFSGLIGGTHSAAFEMWALGGIASQGMEDMAEFGGKGNLRAEVQAAIQSGTADAVISGNGITVSPSQVSVTFTLPQSHPLVSVVSMIAPSPDWFVGVHDLPLFENNRWRDEVVVSLDPYDAGTDSGVTYISPNADVTPHIPIAKITGFPFSSAPPLGTFTFRRID